jgi:hypothetical protein
VVWQISLTSKSVSSSMLARVSSHVTKNGYGKLASPRKSEGSSTLARVESTLINSSVWQNSHDFEERTRRNPSKKHVARTLLLAREIQNE